MFLDFAVFVENEVITTYDILFENEKKNSLLRGTKSDRKGRNDKKRDKT